MMPLWDVEVFADEKRGDMYLGHGWKKFARAHALRDGYLLVFRYDDGAAALTVTVFDRSTCCKQYAHLGTKQNQYLVSCHHRCRRRAAISCKLRPQPHHLPLMSGARGCRTCPWSSRTRTGTRGGAGWSCGWAGGRGR